MTDTPFSPASTAEMAPPPTSEVVQESPNEPSIPKNEEVVAYEQLVQGQIDITQERLNSDISSIKNDETLSPQDKENRIFQKKVDLWYDRTNAWLLNDEKSGIGGDTLTTKDVLRKLESIEDPSEDDSNLLLALVGKNKKSGSESLTPEQIQFNIAQGRREIEKLQDEITFAVDDLTIFFMDKIGAGANPQDIIAEFAEMKLIDTAGLTLDNDELGEKIQEIIRENMDFRHVISKMLMNRVDSQKQQQNVPEDVSDSESTSSNEPKSKLNSRLDIASILINGAGILEAGDDFVNAMGNDAWIDLIFRPDSFALGRGFSSGRFGSLESSRDEMKESKTLDVLKPLLESKETASVFFSSVIVTNSETVWSKGSEQQLAKTMNSLATTSEESDKAEKTLEFKKKIYIATEKVGQERFSSSKFDNAESVYLSDKVLKLIWDSYKSHSATDNK